jgi:SAM-dependent methyltransferase
LQGLVVGLDLPAADEEKLGFNPQALICYDQARRFPVFGKGEFLPFQNDTFDAVLLIEVIEHIVSDREAIKEIHRVRRNGGSGVSWARPLPWSTLTSAPKCPNGTGSMREFCGPIRVKNRIE